jgi:hypothetical protein
VYKASGEDFINVAGGEQVALNTDLVCSNVMHEIKMMGQQPIIHWIKIIRQTQHCLQ